MRITDRKFLELSEQIDLLESSIILVGIAIFIAIIIYFISKRGKKHRNI